MNKIFKAQLYLLLILFTGVCLGAAQEFNKNIDQEKLAQEKSDKNKTFFSKNLDKIKESSLAKWAQDNPKKAGAITTLLALELIGFGLLYSPLCKDEEDLERPICQKIFLAPAYGPFIILVGIEKLSEKSEKLRLLNLAAKKMQYALAAYGKLVVGNK